MTETSNPFDLLDEDTAGSNETKTNHIENNELSQLSAKAWADIADDNDDPLDEFGDESSAEEKVLDLVTEKKIEPISQSLKEADLEWAKKMVIEISHDIRLYNKETDKLTIERNTRRLSVIQKRDYDKLKSLVEGLRTHRGANREVVDKEKQRDKIKLANSLLEKCYKDPRQPCTFVYPVARVHVRDSKGQIRILTRNEVFKASNCYFEIGDIVCDMNKDSGNGSQELDS